MCPFYNTYVIGTVVLISDSIPYNNYGEDKIRRNLILEDVEGRKMDCCFFDGWAAKFDNLYLNREKMGQVVMILQLAKVKYFNEKPSVSPALYNEVDGHDPNNNSISVLTPTKKEITPEEFFQNVERQMIDSIRDSDKATKVENGQSSSSSSKNMRKQEQEWNCKKKHPRTKWTWYAGRKLATGDQNVKIRLLGSRSHDGRQYNLTTANEVATLIVGDFDSMPDERDIIVHENSGNLKTIGELHVSYLPLQYPLLFLYVEDGYRTDIYHKGITDDTPIHKKKYVTMREWFAYRIQDRPNIFSTILNGRIFFQQFLVDGYTMVEAERLRYIRNQNKVLRCETYSRLAQAAESNNPNKKKHGTKYILPSTFTGSPRYMLQNYLDAMAMCKFYGYPDLFITFTCNPKWPEITRFLKKKGLKSEDRPDVTSRVFKMNLDQLMKDIKEKKIFGRVFAVCFPRYNVQSCCTAGLDNLPERSRKCRVILRDGAVGKSCELAAQFLVQSCCTVGLDNLPERSRKCRVILSDGAVGKSCELAAQFLVLEYCVSVSKN
ncbi:putative helitron helicase-like domain-containing protein [Tanacetum coccineum]